MYVSSRPRLSCTDVIWGYLYLLPRLFGFDVYAGPINPDLILPYFVNRRFLLCVSRISQQKLANRPNDCLVESQGQELADVDGEWSMMLPAAFRGPKRHKLGVHHV